MNTNERDLCANFTHAVWLMLGGELPVPDQERWKGHLSQCPDCRRVLSGARAALEAYRALPGQDAPEALIRATVARAVAPRLRRAAGRPLRTAESAPEDARHPEPPGTDRRTAKGCRSSRVVKMDTSSFLGGKPCAL